MSEIVHDGMLVFVIGDGFLKVTLHHKKHGLCASFLGETAGETAGKCRVELHGVDAELIEKCEIPLKTAKKRGRPRKNQPLVEVFADTTSDVTFDMGDNDG